MSLEIINYYAVGFDYIADSRVNPGTREEHHGGVHNIIADSEDQAIEKAKEFLQLTTPERLATAKGWAPRIERTVIK